MTKSELKKLRSKLPNNGSQLIHEKTKYSIGYINMVLAGTKFNQKIIDIAIEIAIEHKKGQDERANLIKSL